MNAPAKPGTVRLVSVYRSIQGEGLHLGEAQVFVRFGGCNIVCDYCDEPDTIPRDSGEPVTADQLKREIVRTASTHPGTVVSWTGGEPLLHARFLAGMMRWARARGWKNYLETNGLLHRELAEVAAFVDTAAIDIKLPSAAGGAFWAAHARFLRAAPAGSFVKVVLTAGSTLAELKQAAALVKANAPSFPFVLQPATPRAGIRTIPDARARRFLKEARRMLGPGVKLIPQWHPQWRLK